MAEIKHRAEEDLRIKLSFAFRMHKCNKQTIKRLKREAKEKEAKRLANKKKKPGLYMQNTVVSVQKQVSSNIQGLVKTQTLQTTGLSTQNTLLA